MNTSWTGLESLLWNLSSPAWVKPLHRAGWGQFKDWINSNFDSEFDLSQIIHEILYLKFHLNRFWRDYNGQDGAILSKLFSAIAGCVVSLNDSTGTFV